MTQARKAMVLILLLTLWSGIFLFQFYHKPEQKRQPLKFRKGDVLKSKTVAGNSFDSVVRLDLLNLSPKSLVISKNIFEPIHIYVPPPPKVEAPPPPPPVVLPPQPTPEQIAKDQATKSLAEFNYLGYLNRGKNKEQGFFSRGGELYNVGKGETIVGTFILKELDPNQAILRDKVTGVEATLILSN
jgi:hypothetical protein